MYDFTLTWKTVLYMRRIFALPSHADVYLLFTLTFSRGGEKKLFMKKSFLYYTYEFFFFNSHWFLRIIRYLCGSWASLREINRLTSTQRWNFYMRVNARHGFFLYFYLFAIDIFLSLGETDSQNLPRILEILNFFSYFYANDWM